MPTGHTALDTTANLTPYLPMLHSSSVVSDCSRYVARTSDRYKDILKPEVDSILNAGFGLILNYEGAANDKHALGAAMGYADASYARLMAASFGAPAGIGIYLSAEPYLNTDWGAADYANYMLPYAQAARKALTEQRPDGAPAYLTGIYTCGLWLDWLYRDNAIDFSWLAGATGWAGYWQFLGTKRYDLLQNGLQAKFGGLDLDWDDVNPAKATIGSWRLDPAKLPVIPSPPIVGPSGQPVLLYGSRGPAVALLQSDLGFTGQSVDGIFGKGTFGAVVAFQTAHHIHVDGIVGPETWGLLEASTKAKASA